MTLALPLSASIHRVWLVIDSATLYALQVGAVFVALQRQVTPAPLARFGSNETEHISPL